LIQKVENLLELRSREEKPKKHWQGFLFGKNWTKPNRTDFYV